MIDEELYDKAMELWGEEFQVNMLIEEMAELTHAIMKTRRHPVATWTYRVLEELADVSIMMDQMEQHLQSLPEDDSSGYSRWDTVLAIRQQKIDRLQRRVERAEEDKRGCWG